MPLEVRRTVFWQTSQSGELEYADASGRLVLSDASTILLTQLEALTAMRAVETGPSGELVASSITTTELSRLAGVTSAIQTQLNGKEPTITGAATTITSSDLTANRALLSGLGGKVEVSVITTDELGRLDNVSSNIQTQLDGKQATITGGATTIVSSDLVINRALISTAAGKVTTSLTSAAELAFLQTVSSNVQTQLNGKEPTVNLIPERAVFSGLTGELATGNTTDTELDFVNGVTSAIQTQLNAKQATITGAATTITSSDLTINRALVSSGSGKVFVSAVTSGELVHLIGVTVAIQTQLDAKQATITGGATTITSANLTTNRALISNGSGKVAVSAVTAAELLFLDTVTSNVQTQLNNQWSHDESVTYQIPLRVAWESGTGRTGGDWDFNNEDVYTTQAQGTDRSIWWELGHAPHTMVDSSKDFRLETIRISRSGTQTFFNKYIYRIDENGVATQVILNTQSYSGDFTWTLNTDLSVANARYLLRLVVSTFSGGGGGGISNPFHAITITGRWV